MTDCPPAEMLDALLAERLTGHELLATEGHVETCQVCQDFLTRRVEEDDLTVEIMELDESGRARGTGRFEKLQADTVILALGQETDSNFLRRIPGMHFEHDVVKVDPRTLMTDVPGIFAGGDAVPSERTVTVGVGHGKRAAIDDGALVGNADGGHQALLAPSHSRE